MTDLIDEVEEDILQQKRNKFVLITVKVILLVAVVSAFVSGVYFWKQHREEQYALQMSDIYFTGNGEIDRDSIYYTFKILENTNLALTNDKASEAVNSLIDVSNIKNNIFADLSKILLYKLGQTSDVNSVDSNSPWYLTFLRVQYLTYINNGDYDQAKSVLLKMKEDDSLREEVLLLESIRWK